MDLNKRHTLFQTQRRHKLRLLCVQSLLQKKRKQFNLNQLTEKQCVECFRFKSKDIIKLRRLLAIPWQIKCLNGTVCDGVEGFSILLRRLAYPSRLSDLTRLFNRQDKEIGMIFNVVLDHIIRNFSFLLERLDREWLSKPSLTQLAEAVHADGAPLRKCWGFIDGTVRGICRPSKYQKECYNGHKRTHSLKYQSVMAANGIIVHLFGPIEGRRHDSFMLSESKLLPQLEIINQDEEEPFCLYGDPAYPLRAELQGPFKGANLNRQQMVFNKKMSKCRITVEWGFGKILSLFAFVDFKKNQKLFLQPVGKYFKVATILTNLHTCLYGSNVTSKFNVPPPTVEDYLNMYN